MITVFTPTYNRRKNLENLYDSLLKQNDVDFEWLIIDDGSTDDTKEYVKTLIAKSKIKIRYYYKKNQGKMSAVNLAHKKAMGEWFITVDSDDYLADNILNKLMDDAKKIKDDNRIAGIVYNCSYQNDKTKIVASNMPLDNTICTYLELSLKYKVTGDKAALWKTDVLKNYSFPIIDGEKFIPDAYLMNEISKKYQIIINNRIVMHINYCEEGLTNNYFNLVRRNPLGNSLYFKQLYEFDKSLYNIYAYLLFSIFGKKKFKVTINEHPAKFACIIMYIPVWIISRLKGE